MALDFMREAVQPMLRALIDLEATDKIGAARYERSDICTPTATAAAPDCCRPRQATVELAIPKLRHGSVFPATDTTAWNPRAIAGAVTQPTAIGT